MWCSLTISMVWIVCIIIISDLQNDYNIPFLSRIFFLWYFKRVVFPEVIFLIHKHGFAVNVDLGWTFCKMDLSFLSLKSYFDVVRVWIFFLESYFNFQKKKKIVWLVEEKILAICFSLRFYRDPMGIHVYKLS